MTEERICEVEGCSNLGKTRGPDKAREPQCFTHAMERWPKMADSHRARKRRAREDGRSAAGYAAQLSRGDRILNRRTHHDGIRHLLGGSIGDGLTVSRLCEGAACPGQYEGYDHRDGQRVPYALCLNTTCYRLESLQANLSRKVPHA